MSNRVPNLRLLRTVVAACAMCMGVECAAQPGGSVPLGALLACRDVADSAQRLVCFDRESARLGPASGVPAASATPPAPQQNAPSANARAAEAAAPTVSGRLLAPTEKFGLSEQAVASREAAAGARAPDAAKIDARIAAVSQIADGRFMFTLDNGQVWRQLAAEGDMLAKPGDAATVSRGVLGSYWLAFASRRGCKVTRLR